MKAKNFLLLLLALLLPAILRASSATVFEGQQVTITVTADGTSPSYQWMKNGTDIQGANATSFVIAKCALTDAATYTVRVYNSAGSIVSDNAVVAVNKLILPPTKATTVITVSASARNTRRTPGSVLSEYIASSERR